MLRHGRGVSKVFCLVVMVIIIVVMWGVVVTDSSLWKMGLLVYNKSVALGFDALWLFRGRKRKSFMVLLTVH